MPYISHIKVLLDEKRFLLPRCCENRHAFGVYIEDITRVVNLYEIYQTSLRVIFSLSYDLSEELFTLKVDNISTKNALLSRTS